MDESVKILVVDDEEVVLLSIRKVFKAANFELDTVQSPQLGLAMMESRQYDVVITDLMMPGMNGLEFLEQVRKIDAKVRVIMITGYATMRTALQSMRRGAFDFLAKPFTKDELSNMVHRAVQHGPMTQRPDAEEEENEVIDPLSPGKVYSLRNHSWARIEESGLVVIGVENNFLQTIGEIQSVELPSVGDYIEQGGNCAKLTTIDERNYALWCPLSGRVNKVNERLDESPKYLGHQDENDWLVLIDPTALEHEIEQLIPVSIQEESEDIS